MPFDLLGLYLQFYLDCPLLYNFLRPYIAHVGLSPLIYINSDPYFPVCFHHSDSIQRTHASADLSGCTSAPISWLHERPYQLAARAPLSVGCTSAPISWLHERPYQLAAPPGFRLDKKHEPYTFFETYLKCQ